jgi:hypothetical protein
MRSMSAWRQPPEFYLLMHGKVIGKRSGWPAGGNRTALLALLDMGNRPQ